MPAVAGPSSARSYTIQPRVDYQTIIGVEGPLVIMDNIKNPTFGEIVNVCLSDGRVRQGQILEVNKKRAIVQVGVRASDRRGGKLLENLEFICSRGGRHDFEEGMCIVEGTRGSYSFLNPYPQFSLIVGVRVAGVLGKWDGERHQASVGESVSMNRWTSPARGFPVPRSAHRFSPCPEHKCEGPFRIVGRRGRSRC